MEAPPIPEVPTSFDFHEMIDTLVCSGPIVAWEMYWDSAFLSTARYSQLNQKLFESFLLSVIYASKETCEELGSIVERMKIFVSSEHVRRKLGDAKLESITALTRLFQRILDKLDVVCDKDDKKAYRKTFRIDNQAALRYLKEDLSAFSCKVGGGLLQRWKKANGILVGDASGGVARLRSIFQNAKERALTDPSYVQYWVQQILDEFDRHSSLGKGELIIQRFKKILGIRDRKDSRWTILMKAFYRVYITYRETMLGEFALMVIKSLEKNTNFSIGPLVQNDPVLNALSVSREDPLVWTELTRPDVEDNPDDRLDSKSWTILNHFYERLDVCRGDPDCMVAGLDGSEENRTLAEAFVEVRSLTDEELETWDKPVPTDLDIEWELMTLSPEEWEKIKERLKPKT